MKNRKRFVSVLAGIMAIIMLLSLILSLIPTKVNAASSSEIKKQIAELKNQKKELESQMKDVQKQTEENEDEIAGMVDKKDAIDQEIFLLYEQIENINQQLSAYALLIADKQDELDAAQEHLHTLSEKNKERVRAMEEDGEITYWSVLFKASDFSDFLDRLSMIDEIAASDRRRLEEMDRAADEVAVAQEALEAEKDELEVVKEEMNAAQAVLDEKRAEADALLAELVKKGYELEDLFAEMEAQEEDFLKEIAQKEKEYNEAKRREWIQYMSTYVTVPPATQPDANGGTTSSGGSNSGTNSGTSSSGSSNTGSNTGSSNTGSSNTGSSNTGSGSTSTTNGATVTFDFTGLTVSDSNAIDATTAASLFNNEAVVSVAATKVYQGNPDTQYGAFCAGKGTGAGYLKLSNSSTNGQLVLTFNKKVAKVEIVCHDWYTKSDSYPNNSNKVAVNGGEAQFAPYSTDATPGSLIFNLDGSSETVTIDTSNTTASKGGRIFIFKIIVTFTN